MTAAELERANLLKTPATALSSAPGVVYFLIFEAGVGPDATTDQITAWIEGRRQGTVLGVARNGDAVGVCFKVAGGTQKTVQSAFIGLDDAPAIGRENLALRFVVQGTDPRKLPDYVNAGASTPEIDDGLVAQGRRALQQLPNPQDVLGFAKWVAILVVIAGAIYLAIQIVGVVRGVRKVA